MIPFLRLAIALATSVGLGASAGFAGNGNAAPRSNVGFASAATDARTVAGQTPDRIVVRLGGQSMLPFFGENSLAVVQRIAAARLRPGMLAVYLNTDGERVAHRVEAPAPGGWQVRGFRNERVDSAIVTDANLLGVVYAIFSTAGSSSSARVAAGEGAADLPLAVGAPAK